MLKKAIMAAFILSLLTPFACKKDSNNEAATDSLATKYAKFQVAVYKEPDLKSYLATLEKGEPVELIEEVTQKIKDKDVVLAKIKLSDDSVGFINNTYLAIKPIVFIEKDVKVYNRNNINSSIYATIPIGTIGFVTDEKADWIKIDIGDVAGKKVYQKWTKGGISDNPEIVADAVAIEKAKSVLSEKTKGDKEEALNLIKVIAQKSTPIGDYAKSELAIMTGNTEQGPSEESDSNENSGN